MPKKLRLPPSCGARGPIGPPLDGRFCSASHSGEFVLGQYWPSLSGAKRLVSLRDSVRAWRRARARGRIVMAAMAGARRGIFCTPVAMRSGKNLELNFSTKVLLVAIPASKLGKHL